MMYFIIILIGIFAVIYLAILCRTRFDSKNQIEKSPHTSTAPQNTQIVTPPQPQVQKPIQEETPKKTARKFSTKKTIALVLLALQILSNIGSYAAVMVSPVRAIAQAIGYSAFTIIAIVLICLDRE